MTKIEIYQMCINKLVTEINKTYELINDANSYTRLKEIEDSIVKVGDIAKIGVSIANQTDILEKELEKFDMKY